MKLTKKDTIKKMINSLKDYAERKSINLEDIRRLFKSLDTDELNSLDDLFNDNGEGRVDYFSVYSMDYARQFTEDVTSDLYDEKRWEVEQEAMRRF